MKVSPQPIKRWRYAAAFRAEALRIAGESRSTQAAARALNSNVKLLYKWQKEALTPVAAARGAELDPAVGREPDRLLPVRQRPAATPAPWHTAAQAAFMRHARRYGVRRLRAELRAESHLVDRYALCTWLHDTTCGR